MEWLLIAKIKKEVVQLHWIRDRKRNIVYLHKDVSTSAPIIRMSAPWGQGLGLLSLLYPQGPQKAWQGAGAQYWWNEQVNEWTRDLGLKTQLWLFTCSQSRGQGDELHKTDTLLLPGGFSNIAPAAKPGRQPWKNLFPSLDPFPSCKMWHMSNTSWQLLSAQLGRQDANPWSCSSHQTTCEWQNKWKN